MQGTWRKFLRVSWYVIHGLTMLLQCMGCLLLCTKLLLTSAVAGLLQSGGF